MIAIIIIPNAKAAATRYHARNGEATRTGGWLKTVCVKVGIPWMPLG